MNGPWSSSTCDEALEGGRNASVVKLVATSMSIALVAKQTNIAMHPLTMVLLRGVRTLREIGPA